MDLSQERAGDHPPPPDGRPTNGEARSFDFLVIGSGLAGMHYALRVAEAASDAGPESAAAERTGDATDDPSAQAVESPVEEGEA